LEKENVWINEGTVYGSAGENFIRINIACPHELLEKGLSKIADTLGNLNTTLNEK
jgi:cystathionine beta-lyase